MKSEANNDGLRRKIKELESELRHEQRKGKLLEAQLENRNMELFQIRAVLDAVFASTSWRVTRPLRLVGSIVKNILKRKQAQPEETPGAQPEISENTYQTWLEDRNLTPEDTADILEHIETFQVSPFFSLFLICENYSAGQDNLRVCLESLAAQLYSRWELFIFLPEGEEERFSLPEGMDAFRERVRITGHDFAGGFGSDVLRQASGDFAIFIGPKTVLDPLAMYLLAETVERSPQLDMVYCDEDMIDGEGKRFAPFFKPDFSPDLLYSMNYIGRFTAFRCEKARMVLSERAVSGIMPSYDFILGFIESVTADGIGHVQHAAASFSGPGDTDAHPGFRYALEQKDREALRGHFSRLGIRAAVEAAPCSPALNRVSYHLPDTPPLVSVIIPTRNRCSLLKVCVAGLLEKTDYPNLEVVIMDNDSDEEDIARYFESLKSDSRVRVVRSPGVFNFSRINNEAAQAAAGDILVLMNNDMEIIDPGWLKEMVGHALRPGIGAVGAKLYYPDGRLQHAGVVIGIGGIGGHAFRFFPGDAHGYHHRLCVTGNYSCVTAACLAMKKEVFREIGGFDEKLAVSFNDVDLCLRIREAGYLIVWTPFAELFHHESASRGPMHLDPGSSREIRFMLRRWKDVLGNDPFYNPNLTLIHENFELSFPTRAIKPWKK